MKVKFKNIICALIVSMISFYTTNVFAINECTKEEQSRLQELANNIKIKYDYKLIEDDIDGEVYDVYPIYRLEMLNSNIDLRYEYKFADESEKKAIRDYEIRDLEVDDGDVIDFYIYSYTDNLCTNQFIKKIRVVLPTYNSFYYFNKEECLEYSDFKYCKEFMDTGNKSYEEIEELFTEYKNEKKTKKKDNFIIKYFWYIFGGVLGLGALAFGIVVIVKKVKEKEDL